MKLNNNGSVKKESQYFDFNKCFQGCIGGTGLHFGEKNS